MAVVVNRPFSGRDRWSRTSRFHGTWRVRDGTPLCATADNSPTAPEDAGPEPDAADSAFPCAGGFPPPPPAAPPQAEVPSTVAIATTTSPAFVMFRITTSPRLPARAQPAHKTTTGGGRFRRPAGRVGAGGRGGHTAATPLS